MLPPEVVVKCSGVQHLVEQGVPSVPVGLALDNSVVPLGTQLPICMGPIVTT